MYVYMYTCIYIPMSVTLSAPGGKHMFKMVSYQLHGRLSTLAHEGSEIWTNRSLLFAKVGLLQLEFV